MLTRLKSRQGILFVCDKCGKAFANKQHYEEHSLLHEANGKLLNSKDKSPDAKDKPVAKKKLKKNKVVFSPEHAFFTCNHCWRQFRGLSQLELHLKGHTTDETKPPKSILKPKLNSTCKKGKESLFMCGVCRILFTSNDQLQTHFQMHVETRPEKGSDEGNINAKTKLIKEESEELLGDEKLQCDENVQERLSDVIEYKSILDLPEEEKVQCENVREQVIKKESVFEDVEEQSEEEKLQYENTQGQCRKELREVLHLENNLKVHCAEDAKHGRANAVLRPSLVTKTTDESLFMCGICRILFASNEHLQSHFETHLQTQLESLPGKDDKIIPKHLIKKEPEYKNVENQSEDERLQHENAQEQPLENVEQKSPCKVEEKNVRCKKVRGKSRRKNAQKQHEQSSSRETFVCGVCDESFKTMVLLHKHLKIHIGAKPFVCANCGDRFSCKRSLDLHMVQHMNDELFRCNVCDKTFPLESYLEKHLEMHISRKNYMCVFCGKTFQEKSALQNHIEVHTHEKQTKKVLGSTIKKRYKILNYYKCNQCDKVYAYKCSLTKHKLKSHFNILKESDLE